MHRGRLANGQEYRPSAGVYGRVKQRRDTPEEPCKDVADIVGDLLQGSCDTSSEKEADRAATQHRGKSAMVLQCLEVALSKLEQEPAWRLAGGGFFDRTSQVMVSAISAEIEASRQRRPDLLNNVEACQERLQYFTKLWEKTHARCIDEDAVYCRLSDKSQMELQEAARWEREEEDKMHTAHATLEALRQRAVEAEQRRQEEQRRQREQLLQRKDGVKRLLGTLREEYEDDQREIRRLKTEASKLQHEIDVTMLEIADLPELEISRQSLEEKHATLQQELQRLIATSPRTRSSNLGRAPSHGRPSQLSRPSVTLKQGAIRLPGSHKG
mmetsp:Transcript_57577/g.134911  ORF Transcript_57577/g.134911 Transcript_57577/m.134911 type:complete len:327 (-) Transcript_57577:62-1042(-)